MRTSERVGRLLAELTLEEKVSLCHGSDFMSTTPVERVDIPRMWMTDGPVGARGRGWGGPTSAYFPCATAMAATWDVELMRDVGEALARETHTKGASVLLGPAVNIHRSPLAGRNFECYSEDPYLTSRMAVAYIEGLQSLGIGACTKHLVCNDSEFERMSISSEVDERTLREIYLPPFEAAVREAGTWWIMGAYNALNGTFCCEDPWLLRTLLREEWGFEGVVVSDWFALKSSVGAANGGCDLEMPGPGMFFGPALAEAVRNGEVDEDAIDEKIRRLLTTLERANRFDGPADPGEVAVDRAEDRALLRRVAADGIVLLRNEGGVLPLERSQLATLAVIGPNADVTRLGGGGSSEVSAHYAVTPLDGIRDALPETVDVVFERGCLAYKILPELPARLVPDAQISYFDNPDLEGEAALTEPVNRFRHRWVTQSPLPGVRFSARIQATFTPDRSGVWSFSLVNGGRARIFVDDELVCDNWTDPQPGDMFFGLGSAEAVGTVELAADRPSTLRVEFRSAAPDLGLLYVGCLPPMGDDAMERAVGVAGDADAALLFVGTSSEWESEGFDRSSMDLPGPQDELIRRVAAVQPNTIVVVITGAPVTMDWADDVPAILQAWFGGQEAGNAVADVVFGDVNPAGRLPTTFPVRYEDNPAFGNYPGEGGKVHYAEGVFVGYRHYDTNDIAPRFPFGHGLSYTSFAYDELSAEQQGEHVVATVEVTNTGEREGAEVCQLYVRDVEASVPRPPRELKAFQKLRLNPGETKQASFALDRRAFQFWDGGWTLEPGTFELLCGSSSRDIRARTQITL